MKEKNDKDNLNMSTFEIVGLLIAMLVTTILLFGNTSITNEMTSEFVCYENVCNETSLDSFNECIDLGVETVGFLASEHYYLCDGIRVTNTCTNYEKRIINSTDISLIEVGMRMCGLKEDAFSGKKEK